MANINNPFGFRPVKMAGGAGAFPTETLKTTSAVTIYEGAPLVKKADGTITNASAASTALFGFAAHGVTAVTGTRQDIAFYPARLGDVFEAQVQTGSNVNLTEAVGRVAGISIPSTYAVLVIGATTSVLQTVGIHPNSTIDLSCPILRVVVSKSSYLGVP